MESLHNDTHDESSMDNKFDGSRRMSTTELDEEGNVEILRQPTDDNNSNVDDDAVSSKSTEETDEPNDDDDEEKGNTSCRKSNRNELAISISVDDDDDNNNKNHGGLPLSFLPLSKRKGCGVVKPGTFALRIFVWVVVVVIVIVSLTVIRNKDE